MSLLCLYAVRRRVIPLWLGVMVAVVGGLGPFAGAPDSSCKNAVNAGRNRGSNAVWSRTRHGGQHHGGSGHAGDGRVGLRRHHPGMAQAGRRLGLRGRDPRRDLDRQGRRRGALARLRHHREDPRRRGRHRRRRQRPRRDRAQQRLRARRGDRRRPTPRPRPRPRPPPRRRSSTSTMPADGRVGLRGHDPRVGQAGRRHRRGGRDDRRDLHRQGGRRAALARVRHAHRDPRRGRRHRRPSARSSRA